VTPSKATPSKVTVSKVTISRIVQCLFYCSAVEVLILLFECHYAECCSPERHNYLQHFDEFHNAEYINAKVILLYSQSHKTECHNS
jgi:hypothetical protein